MLIIYHTSDNLLSELVEKYEVKIVQFSGIIRVLFLSLLINLLILSSIKLIKKIFFKSVLLCTAVPFSGRVWIYTAFSDGLLESYIRLFVDSQRLAKKFYTK